MSDTETTGTPEGALVTPEEQAVEEKMGLEAIPPEHLQMLPGEVRPHPTPHQYVLIAVVLVVITALEVSVSYMTGTIPNGLIVVLLLVMSFVKFFLVASWYMHLRTDRPIFRRFFILGACAAIVLYVIVLSSLHIFSSGG